MSKFRTDASTRREQIVQTALNRGDKFTFENYSNDDFAGADWWIFKNNEVVGVAEFKGRAVPSTKYKTIFLAVRKYEFLLSVAKKYKVRPLMIYGFSDGKLYGFDIHEVKKEWLSEVIRVKQRGIGAIGRNDREPAYEVPLKSMRYFGQLNSEELREYNELSNGL